MHPEGLSGGVAEFDEAVQGRVCPYLNQLGEVALGEMRAVYEQLDAGNYEALGELAERLATAVEQKPLNKVDTIVEATPRDVLAKQSEPALITGRAKAQGEQPLPSLGNVVSVEQQSVANFDEKIVLPSDQLIQFVSLTLPTSKLETVANERQVSADHIPAVGYLQDVVPYLNTVQVGRLVEATYQDRLAISEATSGAVNAENIDVVDDHDPQISTAMPLHVDHATGEFSASPAETIGLPELYSDTESAETKLSMAVAVEQLIGLPTVVILGQLIALDAEHELSYEGQESVLPVLTTEVQPVDGVIPDVLAAYRTDEILPLNMIQEHVDDAPLEQILAELASYLAVDSDEPEPVAMQVRAWLHELHLALKQGVLADQPEVALPPSLKLEIVDRLLAFMLAIGYTNPNQALSVFVRTHGIGQLLEALQYVCLFDAEGIRHESITNHVADAVTAYSRDAIERIRAFGKALCYFALAPSVRIDRTAVPSM